MTFDLQFPHRQRSQFNSNISWKGFIRTYYTTVQKSLFHDTFKWDNFTNEIGREVNSNDKGTFLCHIYSIEWAIQNGTQVRQMSNRHYRLSISDTSGTQFRCFEPYDRELKHGSTSRSFTLEYEVTHCTTTHGLVSHSNLIPLISYEF